MTRKDIGELGGTLVRAATEMKGKEFGNTTFIMSMLGMHLRLMGSSKEENLKLFGFDPVELEKKSQKMINIMTDAVPEKEYLDILRESVELMKLLKT